MERRCSVRSRPLVLTQDGKQFLQTAKEILQLKQQYEETSSKSISGAHFVHLGIEHTVARAILPHVLPGLPPPQPGHVCEAERGVAGGFAEDAEL